MAVAIALPLLVFWHPSQLETGASVCASAACYRRFENVVVQPAIVSEMEPGARHPLNAISGADVREGDTHSAQLLCTLRHGRHLPRRNTRYQAGATYLGRTFTGWISPASWRTSG